MIIPPTVVHCQSRLRQMRGCSRPELWRAEDGGLYVVKRIDNPQHRRVLINEVISNAVLTAMGIHTPRLRIVSFEPEPSENDLHLGSRYPATEEAERSIFDFASDPWLVRVQNRYDFLGALVHDRWLCNTDGRQCIFYRTGIRYPDGRSTEGLVVSMIDNGYALGGTQWEFIESAVFGIYMRTIVYGENVRYRDFEPWVEVVQGMRWDVLTEAVSIIPSSWLHGEDDILFEHLKKVWKRRERLPELVCQSLQHIRKNQKRSAAVQG